MKQVKHPPDFGPYNAAVKAAYFQILKKARYLLSTVERDDLRCSYEQGDIRKAIGILHEMVNPIVYLQLELDANGKCSIQFGFRAGEYYMYINNAFVRHIYRLTAKEHTNINIEDCVRTDRFIYNPDELHEYIWLRDKSHTLKKVKYKAAAAKRKQMQAVA